MKKAILSLIGFVIFVSLFGFISATNSTSPGMATVTIGGFISLSINPGTITFGDMSPGEVKNATNNPLVIAIGSETNVAFVNITTKANSSVFSYGINNNFSVGNMTWINSTGYLFKYSTQEKTVYVTSSYGQNYSMNHSLFIPPGQASGFYNTGIIITGKDS